MNEPTSFQPDDYELETIGDDNPPIDQAFGSPTSGQEVLASRPRSDPVGGEPAVTTNFPVAEGENRRPYLRPSDIGQRRAHFANPLELPLSAPLGLLAPVQPASEVFPQKKKASTDNLDNRAASDDVVKRIRECVAKTDEFSRRVQEFTEYRKNMIAVMKSVETRVDQLERANAKREKSLEKEGRKREREYDRLESKISRLSERKVPKK